MLLPLYEASIASALPTTILKGLSISTSKLSPYLNNLLIINSSYEYISIQHSSKKLKMSLLEKLIKGFSSIIFTGVSVELLKLTASSILFNSLFRNVSFTRDELLSLVSVKKLTFII